MRAVFQQADLDTSVAGTILGVGPSAVVVFRLMGALPEELADPAVVCIEAGGSGQTERNNFDHHDTELLLSCAARQAFDARGCPAEYRALVDFTEGVDGGWNPRPAPFPNVSHLISGIRLCFSHDPVAQFCTSVETLRQVVDLRHNPFQPLPEFPEWAPYFTAKRRAAAELGTAIARAELVDASRLKIGFVEVGVPGAAGRLYRLGADVAVVFRAGEQRKFTISGNGVRVDRLLSALNAVDPGWGGPSHGTVIGSPRAGSRLEPKEVRMLVERNAALVRYGVGGYG